MKVDFKFDAMDEILETYLRDSQDSFWKWNKWVAGRHGKLVSGAGSPPEKIVEDFRQYLIEDVVWWFLCHNECFVNSRQTIWSGRYILKAAFCNYCKGEIATSIHATLRRVQGFVSPPTQAEDLRIINDDFWLIEEARISATCVGPCGRTFSASYADSPIPSWE